MYFCLRCAGVSYVAAKVGFFCIQSVGITNYSVRSSED